MQWNIEQQRQYQSTPRRGGIYLRFSPLTLSSKHRPAISHPNSRMGTEPDQSCQHIAKARTGRMDPVPILCFGWTSLIFW